MRKQVQVLLLLFLVLLLTACGEAGISPQAGSASEQDTSASVPDDGNAAGKNDAAQGENDTILDMEIAEIPTEYKETASHAGEIVRFDYDTNAESKYAYIYLPYGYDEGRQYDILYMMHGGGGSQESLFGGVGQNNDIKNAIDHLIENGEMEPILIVTPTFYTKAHGSTSVSGSWDAVMEFPDELTDYLMPAVESAYSTYAETTDDAGFKASREHRAFGGFSMGRSQHGTCLNSVWTIFPDSYPSAATAGR